MDPITTGVEVSIIAIQSLMKSYDAYVSKKVMGTDQAVCQEVRRRIYSVLEHATINHKKSHRDKNRHARREYENVIDICNSFIEDTRWSITRPQSGGHEGIGKPGRKDLKRLVNHDLKVLNSLESCREEMGSIAYIRDSETLISDISNFSELLADAKSNFKERNMIFDGMIER